MGTFKTYLKENEEMLAKIIEELDELTEDEVDQFGYIIYNEFFDEDGENEQDEIDTFTKEDVLVMVKELGPDMYEDIYDMLEELEDEEEDEEESEMDEGVSRIMKGTNKNRKKRKFMKNSKADLRKTKAARKKDARANKASRKRYYRANKAKIAAYQKSRASAIKKGTHKVKKRKNA